MRRDRGGAVPPLAFERLIEGLRKVEKDGLTEQAVFCVLRQVESLAAGTVAEAGLGSERRAFEAGRLAGAVECQELLGDWLERARAQARK